MSRTPSFAVVCLSLLGFGGVAQAADSAAVTAAIAECDAKVHDFAACTTAVGMFNDDVYALSTNGDWRKAVSVKDSTTFSAALISAMNARFGALTTRIDVEVDGRVLWQADMQAQVDDINTQIDALLMEVEGLGYEVDATNTTVGEVVEELGTIRRIAASMTSQGDVDRARLDDAVGGIAILDSAVSALLGRTDALESDFAGINAQIAAFETRLSGVEYGAGEIIGRIDALEDNNGDFQDILIDIKDRNLRLAAAVDDQSASIDELGRSLVGVWEYTTDLEQDTTRLTADVTGLGAAVALLHDDVGALREGGQCVTAYVPYDLGHKKVGLCCRDERTAGSGNHGIDIDSTFAEWERVASGETFEFAIVDPDGLGTELIAVVNPTEEHLGDANAIVFSRDALHRMVTGRGLASDYGNDPYVEARIGSLTSVMVAQGGLMRSMSEDVDLLTTDTTTGFADVNAAIADLERGVEDLQEGGQCAIAYLSEQDAVERGPSVKICQKAKAGAYHLVHQNELVAGGGGWRKIYNGDQATFPILDEYGVESGLLAVVNPSAGLYGKPGYVVFPVVTLHEVLTGHASVSTYDGLTAARHRLDKIEATVAGHDAELYAREAVDGYSGVVERLDGFETQLDWAYSAVGKNDARISRLETVEIPGLAARFAELIAEMDRRTAGLTSNIMAIDYYLGGRVTKLESDFVTQKADSKAQFETIGTALHTIGDSFATGHTRRHVAIVSGLDAGGAPIYEVISVSDLGQDPEATFTIDLEPLAGDIRALIDGSAAGVCTTVYKGDVPYKVSENKEVRLCLPLSKTDLYFGRDATNTVGTTFINAFDAYEMYTGEKLVFSPYKP